MTATEELRRMLDERGVDHSDFASAFRESTRWIDSQGRVVEHQLRKDADFGETGIVRNLTPAQAIAATLGSGTCELHDCEGSFSAVNKPVWRCDCGAFMTQYTDATTYHKPRYCPNCGRKVVDE